MTGKAGVALWAALATAFAGAASAQQSNWDGVYIGLQGGYSEYDADTDFDGFEYGIFAGYSGVNGQLYGAAELFLNASTVDADGSGVDVNEDYNLGLSVIGGWILNPDLLIYGKYSTIRVQFGSDFLGDDDTFGGYALGIGSELQLQNEFSVRGEVNYFEYDFDGTDGDGTNLRLGVVRRF